MTTSGVRVFTVHSEKRLTGRFRIAKAVGGELQLQVEVEIEKVRTAEQRETYRAYRDATPDDCELSRIKSPRSRETEL